MKLYVLCTADGKPAYNVGCLTFTYNERSGAEQKIAQYEKKYRYLLKQYKKDLVKHPDASWLREPKKPDYMIKEIELDE